MKRDYANPLPKRFYDKVTVERHVDAWRVLLDGRALKTVAKRMVELPNEALAHAVAREWDAVETSIRPEAMPLTRLANIAIDRMGAEREAILGNMLLYAETDLLCYRAAEPELRAQQAEHWDAVLQKLEEFGIRMVTVKGVVPVPQPQASLDRIAAMFGEADPWELAALAMLVPLLGSVLLTLAVWKGTLTMDAAAAACRLDEEFQQSRWGKDEEADALWQGKLRDMRACAVWFDALA